ncbi:MAG: hypothetical protein VXV85_02385, partial [Candidatus Thermoplasmatota archaeon]|nr:hypothetical protein [Candidatus Thermoplasmatota archaeon]
PNDWWNAAEVVFMMSGSWQIGRFANEVGDDFDWWAVPAPCGPAACTGMPGGFRWVEEQDLSRNTATVTS